MKKLIPACVMLALMTIANVSVITYYFNKLDSKETEAQISVQDMQRLEIKINAIYEECRLRDSTIYRALLELREQITGQKTIDQRNKIAEL